MSTSVSGAVGGRMGTMDSEKDVRGSKEDDDEEWEEGVGELGREVDVIVTYVAESLSSGVCVRPF